MINYLQNEDLCQIGVKIADHIAADEAIADYCNNHFGKRITVYVGPPEAALPGTADAPYLFVHDLSKSEGASTNQHKYQCVFAAGIEISEADAKTDTSVVVFAGQQRLSELMTLIQDALYRYRKGCFPPSYIEQSIPGLPGDNIGHWEGFMVAQWSIETPLGKRVIF